jgi:hypothetical protein
MQESEVSGMRAVSKTCEIGVATEQAAAGLNGRRITGVAPLSCAAVAAATGDNFLTISYSRGPESVPHKRMRILVAGQPGMLPVPPWPVAGPSAPGRGIADTKAAKTGPVGWGGAMVDRGCVEKGGRKASLMKAGCNLWRWRGSAASWQKRRGLYLDGWSDSWPQEIAARAPSTSLQGSARQAPRVGRAWLTRQL